MRTYPLSILDKGKGTQKETIDLSEKTEDAIACQLITSNAGFNNSLRHRG
ncbi:MAG: hypothetical protein SAK29_24860 [Scytonema sp. PMC 1069.18]|nr:hypothetical protein [Scytonema sp. PMC 1069.18]MEC4886797.1 hypothetical protein [Scytonema sp. PMC 1070.18]